MYPFKYKQLVLTVAIASLLNQPYLMAETSNPAYFDSTTQRLYVPTLDKGDLGHYTLDFNVASVDPLTFELDLTSINSVTANSYANAYYNSSTRAIALKFNSFKINQIKSRKGVFLQDYKIPYF
ncbi:hypothetical protein [Candidatus Albibeggiatoa sp. nov. BB20]|uniref:hypothetical protein n=1 Tax=Candidatus Albibeggiatoa sp. nov. BB20 TaxID=3162723 RepID=UPI0033658BD9